MLTIIACAQSMWSCDCYRSLLILWTCMLYAVYAASMPCSAFALADAKHSPLQNLYLKKLAQEKLIFWSGAGAPGALSGGVPVDFAGSTPCIREAKAASLFGRCTPRC